MQYGTAFQLPQEPSPTPLLTPFSHLLRLTTNTPPVTRFNIPTSQVHTHRTFKRLLSRFRKQIKESQYSLITADKGSDLVIIQNTTLTELYHRNIQTKATLIHPGDYLTISNDLFEALIQIDPFTKTNATDDRPPTFCFKVKTHKPAFLTSTTPTRKSTLTTLPPPPLSLSYDRSSTIRDLSRAFVSTTCDPCSLPLSNPRRTFTKL